MVILADQRRSSLSRSQRPPCPAKLIARSTIDMPWRNFLSPEFRKKSQREVALFFCKYMSCLNCRKGQKKPPCQKPDYFRSSLLREHRLVTDSHRAIASTNAGVRLWAHSACTQGHCGGNVYSIGQRKRYIHQQFNTDIMYTSKQ